MELYRGRINIGDNILKLKTSADFKFSENTTYGLGGRAALALYPTDFVQARAAYDLVKDSGCNHVVLGNGSNVLAADGCYNGCVISTKLLKGIIRVDDKSLFCLAGTKLSSLLNYCRQHGFGGLEYLYGIPATVGGAAFMNAGVSGLSFGNNIKSVMIYCGKTVTLNNKSCNFGYRRSTMRNIDCIILGVTVEVERASDSAIEQKIAHFKNARAHLPSGRSCGCVFKNPAGASAGQLIEACGLKGLKVGGAEISMAHVNFIINRGGRSSDVKKLIGIIKNKVYNAFSVKLEEEVVYIGDFNDINS